MRRPTLLSRGSVELAGGFEVLDATEGGDDALARGGAVAGVLHDLQVAALSGGFDTEEHAATDCDTALMPRPTEDSQALYGRLRQASAGYTPRHGTALYPAGKCLELLASRSRQVKLLSNSSQELAEQAFSGLLVAPALDEDVENKALLVNSAPEPVLLAGDGDDDLVQVPFVATTRGSPTDAVGKLPAEFQAPLADRLICHRDATRRQHLLDHAQAQRESKIQPDRVANELSGVAIAGIKRVSRRRHWARIPDLATSAKPDAAQLDGAVMTLAGQNTSASLARVATFAHNGHLRRDHLGLKRRCELLRLREPEPEVGQAGLLIALEAGDLHLRRQARLQFRNQLHSPNQLRHQLTLVP